MPAWVYKALFCSVPQPAACLCLALLLEARLWVPRVRKYFWAALAYALDLLATDQLVPCLIHFVNGKMAKSVKAIILYSWKGKLKTASNVRFPNNKYRWNGCLFFHSYFHSIGWIWIALQMKVWQRNLTTKRIIFTLHEQQVMHGGTVWQSERRGGEIVPILSEVQFSGDLTPGW